MSELVSAYPTSGGIYWWASKLGGPAAGFFTGWLNLIGLVAVTAGVSYGCATFIDLTTARTRSAVRRRLLADPCVPHLPCRSRARVGAEHLQQPSHGSHEQRVRVVARRRRVSDRPDPRPRARSAPVGRLRLHRAVQQLGLLRWQHEQLHVLLRGHSVRIPAHAVHDHRLRRLCPPLRRDVSASTAAAKGIWRSIFYSALGGYILLLAVVFAVPNNADGVRTTPASAVAASPNLRELARRELGDVVVLVHLGIGTVLLRDLLPDLGVSP